MISWIIVKQCIRNDDGELAVSDEEENMAQNNYHEKLLNTEFAWDKNSFRQIQLAMYLA